MTTSESLGNKIRILVAICSYGEKNLHLLREIIQRYQNMPITVDVVVLSEAPKELGPKVKVIVGLPTKNPWSLPFGHKAIFAREVEKYDLFLYSEDDIQFTERNIEGFLRASRELKADEVAGFLLYERDRMGTIWLTGFWENFHWEPESVRRRGSYTVAEFTNLHSASYLLTQAQLKRAIASGGFLRGPHEGLYDLLCSAATDPYTSCGFRKVICISAVEDFLVHHTPNRYTGISYLSLTSLERQVHTLMNIRDGVHPPRSLFEIKAKFSNFWWQKSYCERPSKQLLGLIPGNVSRVLSIGCGWGDTEAKLKERGAEVTALPLDSVIGASAVGRGIEILNGTWEECSHKLNGRWFDCVVMTNLLHLLPKPREVVDQCSQWLGEGGTLVFGGPNFERIPWLAKRVLGLGEFGKLRNFSLGGISICGPAMLAKQLRRGGFRVTAVQWFDYGSSRGALRQTRMPGTRFWSRDWVLQARRR